MTTITAKSILASRLALAPHIVGHSLLLRYPRCIHAEFMTHKAIAKNASSSRAIPIERLIQSVLDDPFVPLHWGKNEKGMQANEETHARVSIKKPVATIKGTMEKFVPVQTWQDEALTNEEAWLHARDSAVATARAFAAAGYHKQIVNRLIEPWMHITVLATATNWSNFLHLRDHKDAEPHMQLLAKAVREAIDTADVQTIQPGEWHLPFARTADWLEVGSMQASEEVQMQTLLKLSVARCASTSFKTVEGFDMTLDRATALHDKLVAMDPLHASPCEHQFKADHGIGEDGVFTGEWANPGLGGNLGPGVIQYRKLLPGECR